MFDMFPEVDHVIFSRKFGRLLTRYTPIVLKQQIETSAVVKIY